MQGPPVSVEGDSSSGGVPVDDQDSRDTKRNQGGGGQGQLRGTENSSSVSADETTLREGSSSNATAAAASDAKRAQAEHEGGAGCEDDPVSIETIQNLLLMVPVDLEKLRNLAWEKGGYQTDEVRMKAWPKLLCLDRHGLQDLDFRHHLETPHPMTDQIQRDIDRSLTHFLHIRKWKRQRLQSKREKLRDVINAVVRKYDGVLNYYQGFHDVVSVLLLVTSNTQLTYALTERISHYFFRRDSMREDFGVLTYLMHLLPVITMRFDKELSTFVSSSKVEPYYCMSWVLTWFSHDLQDQKTVSRLYDVLLGSHPTLVLYICAAVVITAREEVLACDCEFSAVHNTLSHAAKGVKDWEAVLQKAKGMFLKCPPRELVTHAPAYIKETLDAGGVTALEFPPPWFTGTTLPDWILLEQSREKEGKKRIGKAAKQWRRAAKLAGAENPDEMLSAYSKACRPGTGSASLAKKILSVLRIRPSWKKVSPSSAAVLSTAVLLGAMSYSYHLSSRQQQSGFFP
ncbi:unnamed protein product [Ectocarpus fasciculatus]